MAAGHAGLRVTISWAMKGFLSLLLWTHLDLEVSLCVSSCGDVSETLNADTGSRSIEFKRRSALCWELQHVLKTGACACWVHCLAGSERFWAGVTVRPGRRPSAPCPGTRGRTARRLRHWHPGNRHKVKPGCPGPSSKTVAARCWTARGEARVRHRPASPQAALRSPTWPWIWDVCHSWQEEHGLALGKGSLVETSENLGWSCWPQQESCCC